MQQIDPFKNDDLWCASKRLVSGNANQPFFFFFVKPNSLIIHPLIVGVQESTSKGQLENKTKQDTTDKELN